MNVAQKLSETAAQYSQKPAVLFEHTMYTYGDLDREIRRYTAMLENLGANVRDRVAIQLPKSMKFIFLELAALSLGAIALPLNADYRSEELSYFLRDSGSRFLFTDTERFSRAEEVIRNVPGLRTVLVDTGAQRQITSLAVELKKVGIQVNRNYPTGGNDIAMIMYTSGTTGRSKGAMITHTNLISNMLALHEIWEWSSSDILLHVLPLFHVHGLFVALHGGLNAGATIIMHERFDPVRTWEAIKKEKSTLFMGVPTIYQRLVNQWELMERKPDLSSMRVFISGSAPLRETLFDRFQEATGFRILERYGMTEAGMITSNPIDPAARKARSVGYPVPGVEVRVLSPDGTDVAPQVVGEVWIRGDNVFKGYWKMPDKTAESFHDDWFKTGDLGYQDPEDGGRLYLVGRAKELIISGGYNVYPREVEDVLESHGAVKEAAVVGLPDEDFGERVTAVVSLNDDTQVSPHDLVRYCKDHLAGYKCPKQVFCLDRLPRNAMGKLQKNILIDRFSRSA